MNFQELTAEVLSIVKRSDKLDLIQSQVRAATLKMHQIDFFKKDLYETGVTFDQTGFVQSFDVKALIPKFRSVHYIRPVSGCAEHILQLVHPANIFDAYGDSRTNIYYLAGRNIQIRSSYPLKHVLFGCYVLPDISTEGWDSWIADEQPFAIIYEAARVVFKTIGFDEQSAQMNSLVSEQISELVAQGIAVEV